MLSAAKSEEQGDWQRPARHHVAEDMDLSRSKEQGYKEVAATTASGELWDKTEMSTQNQTHKEPCKYSALIFAGTARESLGAKEVCV